MATKKLTRYANETNVIIEECGRQMRSNAFAIFSLVKVNQALIERLDEHAFDQGIAQVNAALEVKVIFSHLQGRFIDGFTRYRLSKVQHLLTQALAKLLGPAEF